MCLMNVPHQGAQRDHRLLRQALCLLLLAAALAPLSFKAEARESDTDRVERGRRIYLEGTYPPATPCGDSV